MNHQETPKTTGEHKKKARTPKPTKKHKEPLKKHQESPRTTVTYQAKPGKTGNHPKNKESSIKKTRTTIKHKQPTQIKNTYHYNSCQ